MNFDWKILQEILQFTITMMIGTSIDDRLFKTEFKNSWYVEATTKTKNKKSTLKVEKQCAAFVFMYYYYIPLSHSRHGVSVVRILQYSIWLSIGGWTLWWLVVSTVVGTVIRRLEESETSWFLWWVWHRSSRSLLLLLLVVAAWSIVGSFCISVKKYILTF